MGPGKTAQEAAVTQHWHGGCELARTSATDRLAPHIYEVIGNDVLFEAHEDQLLTHQRPGHSERQLRGPRPSLKDSVWPRGHS